MKIIKMNDEVIEFDNGTKIEYYHCQECFEEVWANFGALKHTGAETHEFKEDIEIEKVNGSGFRIEGFFIPCYNTQNGYYLELIITRNGNSTIIDISNCCLYEEV